MWMKGAAGCDKIWEDKVRDIKMPKCQSTLAFFYVRNAKVLYTNSFDCIKHFGIFLCLSMSENAKVLYTNSFNCIKHFGIFLCFSIQFNSIQFISFIGLIII